MLTTRQFAARIAVCPETVRRWIKAGKIAPGETPGGQYRFTEDQIGEVLFGSGSETALATPIEFDKSAHHFIQKTLAKRRLVRA